ncbi:MAG: sporulation protein YunB [Clostridiales bacterium]|nr:sporulation protein YunB [Clostridiales bacterium]
MNDCTYIVKKKHRGRRVILVTLLVLFGIIISAVIFIKRNVTPMVVMLSNERIKLMTTDAVSNAVLDIMSKNTDNEFMTITRDDKQNIKSVDINADKVTELAQKITIEAQHKINEAGSDGITIPIGSLSGVTLFTGLGPDLKIKIYLVGSTKTIVISEFSESGINQTLHRLYIDITGSVAVAIPGLPSTIDTHTQVLMSETIIIGEVPSTYIKSVNVGEMLDLIP